MESGDKVIRLQARIGQEDAGSRLDQAAARVFPDFSRARLQAWIREGALRMDGRQCRPRDPVLPGALLEVDAQLQDEVSWQPEAIALDIVFEDEHLLVLNKPAGLVVHPAAGHREGTLVNALLAHNPDFAALPRAGVVHRLDKDTSGIMVVAKTLKAHAHLVAQLQDRSMGREYLAVCLGALTGGGTIDAPIGRDPRHRTRMAVLAQGGRPARTHYRVLERFAHHTAIAVALETGRTHQIRVHMAHRHHPLLGDPQYGGRRRVPPGADPQLLAVLDGFGRQALHARCLRLLHPVDSASMAWECALPADLEHLLAVLRRHDAAAVAGGAAGAGGVQRVSSRES